MKTLLILVFIFGLAAITSIARGATVNTVDLLWEGETYVPTFYAGRPLPSPGNLVRVVAIPNVIEGGRRLTVNQLVFQWIKDSNPIQSASGLGKNVLEYRADPHGAASTVKVEVLTAQGERVAETRVSIAPTEPKLALYRAEPLANPGRRRSLAGITPVDPIGTTLIAEPFFFSPSDLANRRIIFDWRVNDERTAGQDGDSRFFTVAAPEQGSGEVKLSVAARREDSLIPTAGRTIILGFGLQNFAF